MVTRIAGLNLFEVLPEETVEKVFYDHYSMVPSCPTEFSDLGFYFPIISRPFRLQNGNHRVPLRKGFLNDLPICHQGPTQQVGTGPKPGQQ